MMEIVNGVACFNCTDVERAKKHGGEDSNTMKSVSDAQGRAKIEIERQDERARVADTQKGENRPLAAGERGTVFNILV